MPIIASASHISNEQGQNTNKRQGVDGEEEYGGLAFGEPYDIECRFMIRVTSWTMLIQKLGRSNLKVPNHYAGLEYGSGLTGIQFDY
jgi:hypothetical protein